MRRQLPWLLATLVIGAIVAGIVLLNREADVEPGGADAFFPASDRRTTSIDPLDASAARPALAEITSDEAASGSSSPTENLSADAQLGPGRVEGAVMSTDSRPIPEATVLVREDGRHIAKATSDAEGRFVLEGLPLRPKKLALRAGAAGFVPLIFDFAIPRQHPEFQDVVLTLPGGREVSGRVIDGSGAPIEDASVWLEWNTRELRAARPDPISRTTDAEGRFHFQGAPRMELEVWAWKPGLALTSSGPVSLDRKEVELRAEPQEPCRFEVQVLAEDGRSPIRGAEVRLRSSPARRHLMRFATRLVTDSRGRASSQPLPVESFSCQVHSGDRTFALEPAGNADEELDPKRLSPGAGDTLQLRFRARAGFRVRGRVQLENGAPLPRVRLQARLSGGAQMFETTTEENGSFALELRPGNDGSRRAAFRVVGGEYDLVTEDQGWTQLDEKPLLLKAARRAWISGRVLGAHSAPVAGVEVRAQGRRSSSSWQMLDEVSLDKVSPARTDELGSFSLRAPAVFEPGIVLVADHPFEGSTEKSLWPRPGEKLSNQILRLESSVTIFGRVFAPDGSPLAGAPVRALQNRSQRGEATNLQGEYRIDGLRPGDLKLEARYRDVWYSAGDELVVAEPGERGPIDITTHEPWILEGRVIDDEEKPIAEAGIAAHVPIEVRPPLAQDTTDDEGAFRLSLPADGPVVLNVSPPRTGKESGRRPSSLRHESALGTEWVELVLPMPGFGTVRGRLRYEAGDPGAVEAIWRPLEEPDASSSARLYLRNDSRFELDKVWAGRYELELRSARFRPLRLPVTVEPGSLTDLGDLSPEPGEPRRFLVVDSSDRPVPDVRLLVHGDLLATTDAAGRAKVLLDPARDLRIQLVQPGRARLVAQLPAAAAAEERTFVLPEAGSIRFRLREDQYDWRFNLEWLSGTPGGLELLKLGFGDFDGRARVWQELPPGRYRIRIWDPDHFERAPEEPVPGRSDERVVMLPEGEEVLVDLSR